LPTTSHYSGYLSLFGKSFQFMPMCRSSQIFSDSSFGFDFLTALSSTFHALVELACLPLPCHKLQSPDKLFPNRLCIAAAKIIAVVNPIPVTPLC
jgi:hypothetical protein